MALTHLETHIDLSPASPKVITDSFTINCTETSVRYKINQDIPHAFLVRTSADITIRNASNTVLTRDDDFYLKQTKRDVYYSKAYSLSSIFSEIQFAEVGVYTVTRHMCVGTYITASYLNALKLAIADIAASIASMALTIAGHTTTLNSHTTTLSDHSSRVTDLEDGLADEITARAAADTALQGNIDTHANNTTDAHGATSAATANKIAIRDANARMQAAAGAASSDVVNKGQMDAALEAMALSAGTGNVTTTDTSATDGEIVVESGTTGKAIKKSGKSIGNASGNVPLANGVKCENLVSAASYAGSIDFKNPIAWVQTQLIDGTYSARFQYRADWNSMPNADVDNWEFLVVSSQHTEYAVGQIRVMAWKINSPVDRATWENRCKDGTWGGWTKLTDASGNAITANNVYMNPSGAALQSGTMTNLTAATANYSGHVYINGNVTPESVVSFYIDDVIVEAAWANVAFTKTLPIKVGQTFKVYCVSGITSCYYAIRASK